MLDTKPHPLNRIVFAEFTQRLCKSAETLRKGCENTAKYCGNTVFFL